MDIGSILAILALAIIAIAFIVRPLFEKNGFEDTYQGRRISSLLAERDRVLTILQELDMDHAMGKIVEGDYVDQRSVLVAKGARVLKNIDLQRDGGNLRQESGEVVSDTAKLENLIEAAIAQMRVTKPEESGKYCGQCGNVLLGGDHFCSRCGAPVPAMETEG